MNSKLRKIEKQLEREKAFSRFLIRQSTAAIVTMQPDFIIVDANDTYLKTVNKTRDEVVGAYCYEISHGVSVPCSSAYPGVKCPMVETLRTGENVHVIHDHKGSDGKPMYCNLTTYPIKDDSGEIIQVVEFWRGITDEFSNRLDSQVKEIKADVQKLVQEDRMMSLGKLAASCAHEINNPIQGLLTFSHYMLSVLEDGPLSAEDFENFKRHLSLMANELERCGDIVSGLLSFSRESSVAYRQVDLNEILDAVLSLTRHKLELQEIQLETEISSRPLMMEGDVSQLQQCFLNLMFNAMEAITGSGRVKVVSRLETGPGCVTVEIHDTGYGIPDDVRDRLFDPFFTTKAQGQGTGLGLSISYGVIKNHKGTIHFNSRVGKGTTFIIKFPAL